MMRAAIYTRISRDETGDALGVERQATDCRQLCARRGWTPSRSTPTTTSRHTLGGRGRPTGGCCRTSGRRAWTSSSHGRPSASIARRESSRTSLNWSRVPGVAVETVKAGVWDVSSSHGRLVARMLGAVSRAESDASGNGSVEPTSRPRSGAYGEGRSPTACSRLGRPWAAGVRPGPGRRGHRHLRRVVRGEALTTIAGDLNDQGVRPRRGNAWTHTGIARLVGSPALGGLVEVDGELRAASFEGVVSPEEWRNSPRSVAPTTTRRGASAPEQVNSPGRPSDMPRARPHLLRG